MLKEIIFFFVILISSTYCNSLHQCDCSIITVNENNIEESIKDFSQEISLNDMNKIELLNKCETDCRKQLSTFLAHSPIENLGSSSYNIDNIPNSSDKLCSLLNKASARPGLKTFLKIQNLNSDLPYSKLIQLGNLCCNRPCSCLIKTKSKIIKNFQTQLTSQTKKGFKCNEESSLCENECRKVVSDHYNYELIKNSSDINLFEERNALGESACQQETTHINKPGIDYFISIQTNQESVKNVYLGKLCCKRPCDCKLFKTETNQTELFDDLNSYLPSRNSYYDCKREDIECVKDCRIAAGVYFKNEKIKNYLEPISSFEIFSELKTSADVCAKLNKVQAKNEVLNQIRNSNTILEEKNNELKNRLSQKDESIQKLTNELERVKNLLSSKSKECLQKSELIEKLETSLDRNDLEIEDLKKNLQSQRSLSNMDQSNYEKEIKRLNDQLNKIDESLQITKDDLGEYKSENASLGSKIQSLNDEKNRLYDKIQQLEIQLVTSNEKHKVCQLEVSQRDQTILKIQTELNTTNEKYTSSLEEIKILQEELERLSQRVKKQSNDMKEMQSLNDRLDEKNSHRDKLCKQMEYEIEQCKQEVTKKDKQIECIKSDWTLSIRNHEEEIRGYKQSYQILSEELNHTKSDLGDFMNKITNLKQKINDLSDGLECKSTENSSLRAEIERYENVCREQESKICQLSSDLCITRNYFDNSQNEQEKLSAKLSDLQNRYESVIVQLERQENTCKNQNEQIVEMKFKLNEKEQSLEACKQENLRVNQMYNEKCSDYKKLSQDNECLNEEIEKINQEYNKLIILMEQSENALNINQAKLNEKIEDCNDLDERLNKLTNEFKAYQQKFQYTLDDIVSRDNRLTQCEYEVEETKNELQMAKNQFQELLLSHNSLKLDYEQILEQKKNKDKENANLENTITEIQMNFTQTSQQLKKEIARMEVQVNSVSLQFTESEKQCDQLTNQLKETKENVNELESKIESLQREIDSKNDEIDRIQINLKNMRECNIELEKLNREKENMISEYLNEKEHLRNEVNESRHQLQHCLAEKAHIEERFMLISRNLEQIQEEIRQKVTDYVRLEQSCQKQQTEIKTLKDRNRSYEDEISDLKKFNDKLKKDLCLSKDEFNNLQDESSKMKSNFFKLEHEVETRREQEKIYINQMNQNEQIIQTMQNELRNERNKQQECHRIVSQYKQQLNEMCNQKDMSESTVKDLVNKLKEKDVKIQQTHQECDQLQQKLRESKEEIIEKDGQIKILNVNLANNEKQRKHLNEEIKKYEEAVEQFKIAVEKAQHQYRECHSDYISSQQQINDLKVMITTLECNHRETLSVVAEKSKENAHLRNELNNSKQHNESILDQISQYEEKYKYAKNEFKKLQEEFQKNQQQLKCYDHELNTYKSQTRNYEDKLKQLYQEISCKDEQINCFKQETQNIEIKYRQKSDEAMRFEAEVQTLNQKCAYLVEETKKLEISLDRSRDNGERLHKESEMVIANVNQWVNEQRNNSEKLASKIREQASALVHMNQDRERILAEKEILQQQIRKLSQEVDNAALDKEKIKALQNHLNQQQCLLNQLQSRLKDYETRMFTSNTEGNKTIDELQQRIRSNIESIQILTNQVNVLQRENFIQKEQIEKEVAHRQTLQMQLDTKNQLINTYTSASPLVNRRSGSPTKQPKFIKNDSPDVGYTSSPSRSNSHPLRAPLKERINYNDETENTDSEQWRNHN
ncbi:unnamed protein product [Brachionus calyciflorus]|uniref:Uncharacterized protein n=1 Tax=Brachionus calyciflorus TaxID=104777 RepID=A0A813W7F4_9BILA|nr:unnamed protein product [Brachionus calyciflorus]